MPIAPQYIQKLERLLHDELGPQAKDVLLNVGMGTNAQGQPLGTFETMHGIQATIPHAGSGQPLLDFTLRHDEETGEFFLNGAHVMTGGTFDDPIRLVATKLASTFRATVGQNLDIGQTKRFFSEQMQAYSGSYLDPATAMTPAGQAKIASERFFGHNFNPATFVEDSGPFQINGQHYFSRTMKMHGPSVEAMYGSLEGSMWQRDANGMLSFVNPKATWEDDGSIDQHATKFVKHAQKRGVGDIGRLIDPVTGMELPHSEAHGYRTDPMTGRVMRDQGYDMNYFIPVGGGGLSEGQVAQYRQIDFQIDRTVSIRGPQGSFAGLYDALPTEAVTGRYQDIPALGRTTGQWDRVDIARDRMQTVSGRTGDIAMIPITMTIQAAGNTAQGHAGTKGFNTMALPGAFGAPAGIDYAMAANAVKDPIAWANANISGNMDYLMSQGMSLGDAVKTLGLDSIYNIDPSRGMFGYDQSNIQNYGVIREAYRRTVTAPWNQVDGGIIARVNTNIGRFGAWQWGNPGLPAEDAPKLASMDPAFYNRVTAYSADKQDPYAEMINSGVAMLRPGQAGFTSRVGVRFEDFMSSVSGYGSKFAGKMTPEQMIEAVGASLDAEDLSRLAPITVDAQAHNSDGTLRNVTLRLPSYRNLTFGRGGGELSGFDEGGGPENDNRWAQINERVSEYTSLASKIMHQRMYEGAVNPEDATRYMELSEQLSYSEGIVRKASQIYLPQSAGGPVFGDSAIDRNVVALGDMQIAKMFHIHDDDPQRDIKLASAKGTLMSGDEAAYYTLYPHLSQNKMLPLKAVPMDSINGLSVDSAPYGIGVNPLTQSQLDKDFDVDAALVALSSKYSWSKSAGRFVMDEAGKGPMSVAELDRRMNEMMKTGQGKAEWNKWEEDRKKYDTLDKLQAFMGNLMPERPALISAADIQSEGYVEEGRFKWDMGVTYNLARRAMAISGFDEMSARMWEPYYQAMLDKVSLSPQAQLGFNVMRSIQPATAGFKAGEDENGDPILGSYRMGKSGGIGMPGMNKALSDILINMFTADEIADPEFIKGLVPGSLPEWQAGFDRMMKKGLKDGPRMASGKLLGSMPWNMSAELGGATLAMRAGISARWKQKNVLGFMLGNSPTEEDELYGEMGESADALVKVLSARFDSQEEMVQAMQLALIQTEAGDRGGIPMGNYASQVWTRMGFADESGPSYRPLEKYSRRLGFKVPGAGQEYGNPALGPGNYQDARIQPEEAKLLRGLEAIGRQNPDQAKEISEWLGAHAEGNGHVGFNIYTNPVISNGPMSQMTQEQMAEFFQNMSRLAVNIHSQAADDRIRNVYNMDKDAAGEMLSAITDVTQGKFVNMADLQAVTKLKPENEIFAALADLQTGMRNGVNGNQLGSFGDNANQLVSFALHQSTRLASQDFRTSLGAKAGMFAANADASYENLASLMDVTGQATPAQMKRGMTFDPGTGSYSFGNAAPSMTDPRQIELTDRAYTGLNKTLTEMEPIVTRLKDAHGDLAKSLQEQLKPLEKAKDSFLGNIASIGQMETVATNMSGGDPQKYETIMRALNNNRIADVSASETALGDAAEPTNIFGRINRGLQNVSEGKGPLGKFLRGGQVLSGMQMFYLSRMDRMFIEPALDASLQGAQDEMTRMSMLGQAGYDVGSTGTSMQAAAAYNIMGNEYQRQAAATWSPAVRAGAEWMSGGAGGAASIGAAAVGATLIGGYVGGMMFGPAGAVVGGVAAGGATLIAGAISRDAYLKENPAFADMEAYARYRDANFNTPEQVASNAAAVRPGMIQQLMSGGMSQADAEAEADRRISEAVNAPKPTMSASEAHGAMMQGIADRGSLRSEMAGLSPDERAQVLYANNKRLASNGLTDQKNQAIWSKNQEYYGGGLRGEGVLTNMAFSGVDIDQGAALLAQVGGGSYASYAGAIEPYQSNRVGYQNALSGLSSQWAGGMASMGLMPSMQGGEAFALMGRQDQDLLNGAVGDYGALYRRAVQSGLNAPVGGARIDSLLRSGNPADRQTALGMIYQDQQRYGQAFTVQGALQNMGVGYEMSQVMGNYAMGQSPAAVSAGLGLMGQMSGLGMDVGGLDFASAVGMGVGGMRVMSNALSGDPNAMSLMGQVVGDNRMITMETGKWGGNAGLPLFTTTMGYGSNSPMQVMNQIFKGGTLNNMSAGLQSAILGTAGPNSSGSSYGGMWGLQDYMSDLSFAGSMASAGAAAGNVRRDMAFTTGEGIGAYGFTEGRGTWAIQDDQQALQRSQQRAQIGWAAQSNALQTSQFLETWEFNRANAGRQRDWQLEDFAFQGEKMMQSRAWAQEDWAFNKDVEQRNYGWQQEDFDTNIRRSSGFARRELMKQKERSTEAYDTDVSHDRTMESRQKQIWKEEDQQFDKQKKRAAELYDISMKGMDMQKRQFLERQALEASHHGQQMAWLDESNKLEDEAKELARAKYKADSEAQLAAIGAQAGIAAKMHEAQEAMVAINREQDKHVGALRSRQSSEIGFYNSVSVWFERMRTALVSGTTFPNFSHSSDDGKSGGGTSTDDGGTKDELNTDLEAPQFAVRIQNNRAPLPSFTSSDRNSTRGNEPGDVYVVLDGDLIAAKLVTRNAKKINRDRKR